MVDKKKKGEESTGTDLMQVAESMPPELAERFSAQGAMKSNMDHASDARSLFPVITVGHGAEVFEMPANADGKTPKLEEFQGIIIHSTPANAYWDPENDPKDDAGNPIEGAPPRPPDCVSPDGIKPHCATPCSDTCAKCPHNEFGSAEEGDGKACSNFRIVHVLLPGDYLPCRMRITPSSFRAWDDYMGMLTRNKIPREVVVTKFSLKREERGQNKWSSFVFTKHGFVPTNEQYDAILGLQKEMMAQMRTVTADDMKGETAPRPSGPAASDGAHSATSDDQETVPDSAVPF